MVEATLLTVLQAGGEGVFVFDGNGICRMVGRRAADMFGLDPAKLVEKSRAEVIAELSKSCEEPETFMAMVGADDLQEPARVVGEVEVRQPKRRVLVWTTAPIKLESDLLGRLILMRDVTREVSAERARRHLLQRVEQLTPIDALTGLANRRRFTEEHEREHGRAMRAWDSYAVIMADVDGMHLVNATFGVPVGDQLLERIADLLRTGRREYDVVARWEDDSFAILLPGADAVAARTVADRIQATLASGAEEAQDGPTLSMSLGVAVCTPPTGEAASDVVVRGETALETARKRGSSQIEVDAVQDDKSLPRL